MCVYNQSNVSPTSSSHTSSSVNRPSELLKEHGLDMTHITHINVLISSMDHFPDVNTVFATTFGTSPPTRACVAVDLPNAVRVRMDCVANASRERQALHVQGMSYWAPANIGPYSQSIVVRTFAYLVLVSLSTRPLGGQPSIRLRPDRLDSRNYANAGPSLHTSRMCAFFPARGPDCILCRCWALDGGRPFRSDLGLAPIIH